MLLLLTLHYVHISKAAPVTEALKGRVESEDTLKVLPYASHPTPAPPLITPSSARRVTLLSLHFRTRTVNLVIEIDQVIGETP